MLRRDIDRTQDALSDTIEALEEKLSPGALIAEVQGPVEDTTDHIVAEVKRAVQESIDHALAQVREPVEEISDHLIVRATTATQEMTDHILERARETAADTVATIVAQTGQALRAATIGKVETMATRISETTRDTANSANETTMSLGGAIRQTIQQNPLPAALAAFGLGWLYLKRPQGTASRSADTPAPGIQALGAATQAAGNTMSAVGDTVGGAAGAVGDTVAGTVSTVGDTLGTTVGAVGETVWGERKCRRRGCGRRGERRWGHGRAGG